MPKSDSKTETTQKIRTMPLLALATVIVGLAPTSAKARVRYIAIDLGTVPGYPTARAWSINNSFQIVGFCEDVNYMSRAVLFDTSGDVNNIDLGTLGGEGAEALSINNNGQIVGAALDNNDDYRATIFDPNGGGSNIAISTESVAVSNNDNGQIVGSVLGQIYLEKQAALFDINDANDKIHLGSITGFSNSEAYSINNAGQIAGYAYNGLFEEFRAVLFDTTGSDNNIDLGTLGGQNSAALSINDEGQIVGRAETHEGYTHAVIFDPTGEANNIDLGTLPGYNTSIAISINNRGYIVGQVFDDSSRLRAVLFDPTGQGHNVDLNDLINPALGWTFNSANSINDDNWIVGIGRNPNGFIRAFLLKPATQGDLEPDGDVDLADFAVFASAWQSRDGDIKWNVFCDISSPEDGVVDELDLSVFCSNWLAQQ